MLSELPPSPGGGEEALDAAEQLMLEALEEDPDLPSTVLSRLCAARPELAEGLREAHRAFVLVQHTLQALKTAAPTAAQAAGTLVAGRFQVLGQLGRGGMSLVLAAWDRQLRRKVALKLVHAPLGADERTLAQRRARLVHEAQVLAQLDHPGIVPVHDVVRDERQEVYVAMQRVRGVDLRAVYQRHWAGDREWSLARTVGVLQRTCEAVAYAHDKGVLHRDLKPANVMVGAFGETFVMDWGLARTGKRADAIDLAAATDPAASEPATTERAATEARSPIDDPAASLSVVVTDRDMGAEPSSVLRTLEGDVLGTPSYMSPEQAAGRLDAIDARSDVYGAGSMLYELLAGHAPYLRAGQTRSSSEILADVRAKPPEPLRSAARHAPVELVAIAERTMARDPAARYPSMLEVADDLRAFLEGRVVRAHRTGAWSEAKKWIGRHRGVVAVLGMLVVTVIAATITFAMLYRESERRRLRVQTAQLDSQRRINALAGFSFAGTPAQGFVDEFDGHLLHRRWTCQGLCGQISSRNGALVLSSPGRAQQPTILSLDPHVQLVHGDFDVRVAFRLGGFDLPEEPRGGRVAGLQAVDARTGAVQAAINREVEREPTPPVRWEHSYRCYNDATASNVLAEHCAAADGSSGVLRLTRTGSEYAAWCWLDGWRELFRAEGTTEPVYFRLFARNWYAAQPFEFAVERFELIADPASAGAEVSGLADGFDGVQIDPRFTVKSRSAIAAQVDGRLYLE
ncbi:MAG: serine/threonine-protein kinase, partial [Planctomycetota bacterium]